jgi:hypothetical protein
MIQKTLPRFQNIRRCQSMHSQQNLKEIKVTLQAVEIKWVNK